MGKKGQSSPIFTENEKREIVKKVCDLYESQDATLESCCEAAGVSVRAFRYWVTLDADFAELYKKAKSRQIEIKWDRIRERAVSGLERLVSGEVVMEKKYERGIGAKGSIFSKDTETEVVVMPNPTAVIFALKGEFPERFAERQKVENTHTVSPPAAISVESIESIEKLLADGRQDSTTTIPGKSKAKNAGT